MARFTFSSPPCPWDVFQQVILEAAYNIRSFPQFQRINGLYQTAKAEGHRPLIIDCGANIGLSTVWFSHLFPEAQIFAVEPAGDNIEIAKRNLRVYPNVTLLQGAIWDRPTGLTISDTTAEPWAYQVVEVPGGVAEHSDKSLKTLTIPELIDMADARHALIVKIDIEGAEAALFRSNTEWVGITDLIVIELHDWMFQSNGRALPSFDRSQTSILICFSVGKPCSCLWDEGATTHELFRLT